MEDFRSKNSKLQAEGTYDGYGSQLDGNSVGTHFKTSSNRGGMQDLRCYSASYASSSVHENGRMDIVVAVDGGSAAGGGDQWKFKKGKSMNGVVSKSWSFNDPELQRKKRIAGYKAYSVEGKLKGSIKKSFRWVKERYSLMLYGHR